MQPNVSRLLPGGRYALTRRRLLQAGGAGAAAVAASSALAGCGSAPAASGATGSPSAASATDRSDTDRSVVFSNWQLYIDVDDKNKTKHPTLEEFTKRTGISVTYTEDIDDAEAFYAKVAPIIRNGQDTGRDLMVPTEEVAARMIRQGMVQAWDRANTPLVTANLIESLRDPSWDPGRQFTTPWQSGVTGIAYNAEKVKEVRSLAELLTRPDLKGRVDLLTEWRDTIGLVLLDQGKASEQFTDDDYAAAIASVQSSVDSKHVRRFTGNDYTSDLANGSVYACLAWSGDVVQLQADNPNIKFVKPETGVMIWADAIVIPALAQHKKNAEKLVDFYYDPKVAAQLTAWVQYICPVKGAQKEMEKIDPTLVDNKLIFPDEAFLADTHTFMSLTAEQEKSYAGQFQSVMGA